MALTPIQQVRLNVQDNTPGLYIISDDEISYLLEKYNNSVDRASYRAAQIILLNLAQRGDEQVSIFSIKGSKAAEAYRAALELFLKDPANNPVYQNLQGYFSGVSISDMEANDANPDNKVITSPHENSELYRTGPFTVGWRF